MPPFSCPICNNIVSSPEIVAYETSEQGDVVIQRCRVCYLHFTWPRLSDPQKNYYTMSQALWDKKYAPIARGTLCHDRHSNYLEEVQWIRRYIPKGALLDVGCNAGWLLGYLQQYPEYHCEGLEPSPLLAREAHKRLRIPIHQGYIASLMDQGKKFDGIIVIDVIEHIIPEDINAFIKNISSLLTAGGYLFIKTPNVKFALIKNWIAGFMTSATRKKLLGVIDVWDAKEHVIHWDVTTLMLILNRYHLRIIKSFVPRPIQTRGSPIIALLARRCIYYAAQTIGGRWRIPSFAQDIFCIAKKEIN